MRKLKIPKVRIPKKAWLPVLILVALFALLVLVCALIDLTHRDTFYPGVKIAGVGVSGLTKNQAQKIFEAKIEEFDRNGQQFFWNNKYVTVYPTVVSASDPDLIYEIVAFNLSSTLNKAYAIGRGKNFWHGMKKKIFAIFNKNDLALEYNLDTEEVEKILQNNYGPYEDPGTNPSIEFTNSGINITKEKLGLTFNYNEVISKMGVNVAVLNFPVLELTLTLEYPDFKKSEAEFLKSKIRQVLDLTPIEITATTTNYYFKDVRKSWIIYSPELKKWLDLGWNENKEKPQVILNPKAVANYFKVIEHLIERPLQEGKFKLENNKVVEFQPSRSGKEINLGITLKEWQEKIIEQGKKKVEIAVHEVYPQSTTDNINDLGIRELLGVGSSNFAGSPVNRRHNIKTGAEWINGMLIKPGEEFSMNGALGDIAAAKGYLPELVIKGNETVPEYGGGLCQIATTMFRLAINTGLEITARKTHAYRVGYYEPAGTDATIYSPWPDLRFINDTPNYLLLLTKVEGDDVSFEFWGTPDGRTVATTTPEIYNIVAPGPTKYIETTELTPEKMRCMEVAHYGADAHFYRTITWPDKEPKEEIWESHYRPWQAVCMVGVEATTTLEVIE